MVMGSFGQLVEDLQQEAERHLRYLTPVSRYAQTS